MHRPAASPSALLPHALPAALLLSVLGGCKADPDPQSEAVSCDETGGGVSSEVPFDGLDNDCDEATDDLACERGLAGWVPAGGTAQEISADLGDVVVLDEPGMLVLC